VKHRCEQTVTGRRQIASRLKTSGRSGQRLGQEFRFEGAHLLGTRLGRDAEDDPLGEQRTKPAAEVRADPGVRRVDPRLPDESDQAFVTVDPIAEDSAPPDDEPGRRLHIHKPSSGRRIIAAPFEVEQR